MNSEASYTLKLLVLVKNAHIYLYSVLKKTYMALTEIHFKICGFCGSLGQKGSRPLP